MNKSASAQDFEKKILNLVKNRNYSSFIKAPAVAGATIGGVGGSIGGLGETYLDQLDGKHDQEGTGALVGRYASNALKRGTQGALGLGSLGALKGLALKNQHMSDQLQGVKNNLGRASIFGGSGERAQKAKSLWEEMATSGKFNDVNLAEHLAKSDSSVDKGLGSILKVFGHKTKSPEEMLAARQQLQEELGNLMSSGNLKHIDTAGLSEAEKELIKDKYNKYKSVKDVYGVGPGERGEGARKDLEAIINSMGESRSSIAPDAGKDTVLNMKRKAQQQAASDLNRAAVDPQASGANYANINSEMQRVKNLDEINKLHARLREALDKGDSSTAARIAKKLEDLTK